MLAGVAAGRAGRPAGRPARSGVPRRGRVGSGEPGVVAAGRASAAGPHGVPGGRLPGHRARHQDRRVVLALLGPADRAGLSAEQIGSRSSCRRWRTARPVRRSRLPADVAGGRPGSGPAVPARIPAGSAAGPGDVDRAVPGRPADRGRCPRWGPAAWRPAPGEPKASTATAPPITSVAHRGHRRPGIDERHWQPTQPAVVRGRAGEPARACRRWWSRGAVRPAAAHPGRGEVHRRDPAGGR